MYEEITEQSAVLDAVERALGTDVAEQAAHLYEDLLDDHDQFNVEALRELERYLEDHPLNQSRDTDTVYILNQCHSMIAVLEKAEAEAQAEQALEKGHTIKLEMRLDAQIALAIGSGRVELLPTEERIAKHLTPDDETTPNEAALMANLRGWIGMAVEASRVLIEAKQEVAKLEEKVASQRTRLAVIDNILNRDIQTAQAQAARVASGSYNDDEVYEIFEDRNLID